MIAGPLGLGRAIRTRGVMTSPAWRSPKATERCISLAVPGASVPWRRSGSTSEASSSACVRTQLLLRLDAEPVHKAFAEPLSSPIGPRIAAVNPRWNPWTAARRAQRPRDGEVLRDQLAEEHRDEVASDQADGDGDPGHGALGTPRPRSGSWMSCAIAGSARNPIARFVTVMPTWAPESWVDSD